MMTIIVLLVSHSNIYLLLTFITYCRDELISNLALRFQPVFLLYGQLQIQPDVVFQIRYYCSFLCL